MVTRFELTKKNPTKWMLDVTVDKHDECIYIDLDGVSLLTIDEDTREIRLWKQNIPAQLKLVVKE